MKTSKLCPITGKPMRKVFTHRVLAKYDVDYYYSDESGIIQTEDPFWLQEAYVSVISELDCWTGNRNLLNQRRLEPILASLFDPDGIFVDVGCGYGLLVRLMRDIGFNFFGHDDFCQNLFSRGFNAEPGLHASAICAFEVMEHLTNPCEFLAEQFQKYNTSTLIASTCVFQNTIPDLTWTYYSFESGQHVSFYQPRTLHLLAQSQGCQYFPLGGDLHLFTKLQIPRGKIFLLTNRYARRLVAAAVRFKRRHQSYTLSDYEMVRENIFKTTTQLNSHKITDRPI